MPKVLSLTYLRGEKTECLLLKFENKTRISMFISPRQSNKERKYKREGERVEEEEREGRKGQNVHRWEKEE